MILRALSMRSLYFGSCFEDVLLLNANLSSVLRCMQTLLELHEYTLARGPLASSRTSFLGLEHREHGHTELRPWAQRGMGLRDHMTRKESQPTHAAPDLRGGPHPLMQAVESSQSAAEGLE